MQRYKGPYCEGGFVKNELHVDPLSRPSNSLVSASYCWKYTLGVCLFVGCSDITLCVGYMGLWSCNLQNYSHTVHIVMLCCNVFYWTECGGMAAAMPLPSLCVDHTCVCGALTCRPSHCCMLSLVLLFYWIECGGMAAVPVPSLSVDVTCACEAVSYIACCD